MHNISLGEPTFSPVDRFSPQYSRQGTTTEGQCIDSGGGVGYSVSGNYSGSSRNLVQRGLLSPMTQSRLLRTRARLRSRGDRSRQMRGVALTAGILCGVRDEGGVCVSGDVRVCQPLPFWFPSLCDPLCFFALRMSRTSPTLTRPYGCRHRDIGVLSPI